MGPSPIRSDVTRIADTFREALVRHRRKPLLRAAMAACALVAVSDGRVRFSERVRLDQILDAVDKLKIFNPHEGVDLFDGHVEEILKSPQNGREKALRAIAAVSDDPESATLLARICLAVGQAGGGEALPKKIEIVTLCNRLGIDPATINSDVQYLD